VGPQRQFQVLTAARPARMVFVKRIRLAGALRCWNLVVSLVE